MRTYTLEHLLALKLMRMSLHSQYAFSESFQLVLIQTSALILNEIVRTSAHTQNQTKFYPGTLDLLLTLYTHITSLMTTTQMYIFNAFVERRK